MRHLFSIGLALILAGSAIAELVPADRLVNWEPGVTVGVEGGIDQYLVGGANDRTNIIDVTQAPYNADNTGATNSATAINSALNAASDGDVIYLPAGTYKLDAPINAQASRDGITIRGDGPTTILAPSASASGVIYAGGSDAWVWPIGVTVTAGLTRGSTSVTVSDGSEFVVGRLIHFAFTSSTDNSAITAGTDFFSFDVGGTGTTLRQVSKVVGKTGNVLTIAPGLYHAPVAGLPVTAHVAQLQLERFGIEDLALDLTNNDSASPIQIEHALNCWVKGVKVENVRSYCLQVADSMHVEVRRCILGNRRSPYKISSSGGALLVNTTCASWFEDNVMYEQFPVVEVNSGSSGNAFSYNLCEGVLLDGVIYLAIDTNHGPWNHYNLYEGNVTNHFASDGYFGGSSHDTALRNWINASSYDATAISYCVALKRFTRKYNLLGNILGRNGVAQGGMSLGGPNMGNGDSTGTAQPSVGDFWNDWKSTGTLTTRTSNTVGTVTLASGSVLDGQLVTVRWGTSAATGNASSVAGSVFTFTSNGLGNNLPDASTALNLFMQPGGYQELDLDVEATLLDKGNYTYGTSGASGSMSSLGGDPLPDSYLYDSKPSFFGALAWPPFDPASPNSASYEAIPAGYRYVNGEEPEPSTGKRVRLGAKDARIGGKRVKVGNN